MKKRTHKTKAPFSKLSDAPTLHRIEHEFVLVDFDEGIVEVQDDMFQRVRRFVDSKRVENLN